jgi:hypothetical protein
MLLSNCKRHYYGNNSGMIQRSVVPLVSEPQHRAGPCINGDMLGFCDVTSAQLLLETCHAIGMR